MVVLAPLLEKTVDITVRDLIRLIPAGFKAEKSGNLDTIIQIVVTGLDGGEWVVRIKDQKCVVEDGMVEKADFTLSTDKINLLKIFFGELDPLRAYMQGKVGFKGRIKQALELTNLFSTDRAFYESLL